MPFFIFFFETQMIFKTKLSFKFKIQASIDTF